MFQFSSGQLKELVNQLDVPDLTCEDSGDLVLKLIQRKYAEFVEKKLPKTIEERLYGKEISRNRGETMLQYANRRDTHFKELT